MTREIEGKGGNGFIDEVGVLGATAVTNVTAKTAKELRHISNRKTALVSNGGSIFRSLEKLPMIGAGLYNWFIIYNSDTISTRELGSDYDTWAKKLEEYEVLFVNLSGEDIGLPFKIRKALGSSSSTKLVVNNDYSIEVMQKILQEQGTAFRTYVTDLLSADVLTAQEPFEYELMQLLVEENINMTRKANLESEFPSIYQISHPIDTDQVKTLKMDLDKRLPWLGTMYHRFDGHTFLPAALLKGMPESWFNGMDPITVLFGYTDKHNIMGGADRLFNSVFEMMPWGRYIQIANTCLVMSDYYTISSHSRLASEMACLDIPLVSTQHSYNAMQLYPDITHDYRKLTKIKEEIQRLVKDEKHWWATVEFAREKVEDFNYKNSHAKMEEAIDGKKN